MSLCLVYAFAFQFDQSDWLKLLGIGGAMLALYILARKLSGGDEAVTPPSEIPTPVEIRDQPKSSPDAEEPEADELDEPGDQVGQRTEVENPPQRRIRIAAWNFEHFDIDTGPPDPASFADDLLLKLYDSSSGRSWDYTYFVATPAGLEEKLRSKHWSSMVVPETVVMDRYDVKELRAAILDLLGAMETPLGDVPDDSSDEPMPGDGHH